MKAFWVSALNFLDSISFHSPSCHLSSKTVSQAHAKLFLGPLPLTHLPQTSSLHCSLLGSRENNSLCKKPLNPSSLLSQGSALIWPPSPLISTPVMSQLLSAAQTPRAASSSVWLSLPGAVLSSLSFYAVLLLTHNSQLTGIAVKSSPKLAKLGSKVILWELNPKTNKGSRQGSAKSS